MSCLMRLESGTRCSWTDLNSFNGVQFARNLVREIY